MVAILCSPVALQAAVSLLPQPVRTAEQVSPPQVCKEQAFCNLHKEAGVNTTGTAEPVCPEAGCSLWQGMHLFRPENRCNQQTCAEPLGQRQSDQVLQRAAAPACMPVREVWAGQTPGSAQFGAGNQRAAHTPAWLLPGLEQCARCIPEVQCPSDSPAHVHDRHFCLRWI